MFYESYDLYEKNADKESEDLKMLYVVVANGFFVTDEFDGTYEECVKFVKENQKDYKEYEQRINEVANNFIQNLENKKR